MRFDNGQEKELPSNVLKVESAAASIPPDMPLPDRQHIRDVRAIIETNADVQEATEDEDLPVLRPEEEDAEAAEEEVNGGEAEEDNNGEAIHDAPNATNEITHDPNGRMPGQIPTAAAASVKDYHSIKKAAKEKIAALVGTEVSVVTKKKWDIEVDSGRAPCTSRRKASNKSRFILWVERLLHWRLQKG